MANAASARQDPAKACRGPGARTRSARPCRPAARHPHRGQAHRADRGARHPRPPARRPGRDLLAVPPVPSERHARQIDWRRSASSDHLYVREREWEAAHTVWLWPDLSPSMDFRSHLSTTTKRERAIVLMLAAAELLVRGGERVALLGLTQPTASRKATTRIAEAILAHQAAPALQATQAAEGASGALLRRHPVQRFPRSDRDQRASTSSARRRRRRRPPRPDPRPGRGDAALRRAHRVPEPRTAANAGSPTASQSLRARYREQLEAHRAELIELRQAARLVVPRASHRPLAGRAAADAHHAHAGRRRRPPLARPGAAATAPEARA